MLFDIKFSFFPGSPDCIAWSADGDIALINGEFIRSPNALSRTLGLSAGAPDSMVHTDHTEQWALRRFRANAFTTDEVPMFEPMGFKGFSIGEEQSPALVVGLQWSPPGVARYRRCVLGVLNQNHILSLWEGGAGVDGWGRRLVINQGVGEYWQRFEDGEEEGGSMLGRLRRRIRAWGWSWESLVGDTEGGNRRTGEFFVALTNDNREIAFARIRSTRKLSKSGGGEEWRTEVVAHTQAHAADEVDAVNSVSPANRPARFINKVAWSPWYRQKPGRAQALVAYSLMGRLMIMGVSMTTKESPLSTRLITKELEFQVDFQDVVIREALTPRHRFQKLLWYEKIWNDRLILAIASPGSIRVASVLMGPDHKMEGFFEKSITVDEYPVTNWDSVSGMVIQVHPSIPKTLHVHIATILSHNIVLEYTISDDYLHGLQTSLSPVEDSPSWADSISSLSSDFDAAHDLGSLVSAKTWGIAQSPLGGYIAACVTLHPSGMIEYNTPKTEICHIVFGNESEVLRKSLGLGGDKDQMDLAILDAMAISVEAFVHEIRYLDDPTEIGIIRQGQGRQLPIETFKKILKRLQDIISKNPSNHSTEVDTIKYPDTKDPLTLTSTLRHSTIYNPILTAHRYHHLITSLLHHPHHSTSPSGQPPNLSDGIPMPSLTHLITSVLALPHPFTPPTSTLTPRILYAFACIGALGLHDIPRILELSEQAFTYLASAKNVDLGLELEHCRRRREVAARGPFGAGGGDMRTISFPPRRGGGGVWEVCEVCGRGIGWGDLRGGRCGNGHVFVRCALTFLAIQRPGVSKFCGVCGKEYLTEEFVEQYDNTQHTTSPSRSGGQNAQDQDDLAEVLLDAAMEVDTTEDIPTCNGGPADKGKAVEVHAEDEEMEGDGEARPSLASLLFAACEVCVYCGGKFTRGVT